MTDAIDLFTRTPRSHRADSVEGVNSGHLEMAERLAAQIKNGEIESYLVLGTRTDGNLMSMWTASTFEDPFTFIGLLEQMKQKVLMDLYQKELEYED